MAQTTISGATSAQNASQDNGGSIPTSFAADGSTNSTSPSNSLVNTGGLTSSGASSTPNKNWGSSAANYDASNARVNPLHSYVNYTYKFSLYAIPESTANLIANGSIVQGQESQILTSGQLIASDGGSATSAKSQFFQHDLGIDNVLFSSQTGAGARTRGTNVLQITFDIIEPYTCVFIPNLVLCAQTVMASKDWHTQCYVMKLEFLGYNDEGIPSSISGTTKYIPFTIGDIKFRLTQKGSTYSIIGLPMSAIALTPIHATLPFHSEVGGATINDFFNTDGTDTKGIAQVLNDAENAMISNTGSVSAQSKTYPDTYKFVFDTNLTNATVVDPANFKNQSFAMSNPAGAVGNSALDASKVMIRLTAGTKIPDLIKSVITNSSFMTGQVNQTSGPINMWKIVPTVALNQYDPLTKRYARTITYNVSTWPIYGRDNQWFSSTQPTKVAKVYNYFYTGLNQDIEHMELDYHAYYARTYNVNAYLSAYLANDGINTNLNVLGPSAGATAQPDGRIFRPENHFIYGNAQYQNTGATTQSPATSAVNDLLSQIFDSDGEMLTMDATIVGDPDLIQQDDVLLGTNSPASTSPNYSAGEVYMLFNFNSPTKDYDDSTGLFSSMNAVPFTGLYSIMQVDSIFQKGKFTQKLHTQRVAWQPTADSANNGGVSYSDSESSSSTLTPTVLTVPVGSGTVSGLEDGIGNDSSASTA